MKPVFQQPMDGRCMQACVASILGLRMDQVPGFNCEGHTWDTENKQFICTIPEHSRKWKDSDGNERTSYNCENAFDQTNRIKEFLATFGLTYTEMYMEHGHRETGPRPFSGFGRLPTGYCIATGPSPRFDGNHAVVWDTRLIDFEHPYGRMVHDPTPVPEGTRPGIKHVLEFGFLEVVDTDKLVELVRLQSS